jgi:lysozyme
MITSLERELTRDEGKRSKPYRDSLGFLTIGIGHNLDAEGLCEEAIAAQFRYDLDKKVFTPLDARLPWWRELPEPVQRVIANLTFNLGIVGLLKWRIFLAQLKNGRYANAAANLRSNRIYTRQVGERAERLARLLDSVV